MKSLFQSFGYAQTGRNQKRSVARNSGERITGVRVRPPSSLPVVPGGLDEAKDVAIEPVVGRAADSKRLARLEAALWTE